MIYALLNSKLAKPKPARRSGKWSHQIAQLDAHTDAEDIGETLLGHVFPLDIFIATEIGQLRTFTVPSISELLHRTGQYEHEGVKRLDDTKAILREMFEDGLDSERGQVMTERLNQIHGFYEIANDDYLYVLSAFFVDASLWMERYGWREYTPHEKLAIYNIYRDLGERMNMHSIPDSFEAFVEWRADYEAKNQRFAESNYYVAMGLIDAVKAFVPRWLGWAVLPVVSSLIDDEFRALLGLPRPNRIFFGLVQLAMKIRKFCGRYVSLWERASFTESPLLTGFATYKNGYDPLQLGPTKLINKMRR